MSQYFRKLKAKWKDPRCRSLGGGQVFLGPDDKVGLKCTRFDLHTANCKCKEQKRARRILLKQCRQPRRLYGRPVDSIIIDEAYDIGVDLASGSDYTVTRPL